MKKYSSSATSVLLLSFLLLALAPIVSPFAAEAFAATTVSASPNSNVLVSSMCNAIQLVTGNAGKTFAAFAIISMGIGFFTGKISWGLMIGIAMGVAAMFGAPSIVSAISGEESYDCTS